MGVAAAEKALEDRIKGLEAKVAEKEKALAASVASGSGGYTPVGNRYHSVEQKMLQAFQCSHPKQLLEINTALPRYAAVPMEYKQMALAFKETVDVARYTAQICRDGALDKGTAGEDTTPRSVKQIFDTNYGKDVLIPMAKSFGTSPADDGGAWIPTAISSTWIEEFELERRMIRSIRELPMPTNPWKLSVQKNTTEAKIAAEKTPLTDDNFQTTTIDFDATKLGEFYCLPEELNEDSAPPILAIARAEVAEAQMRALEQALVNGDDSGTHQDDDTDGGAANLAAKTFKGLRKLGLANSANGSVVTFSSAVTTAKLDEMRKVMGKFGINPRDLMYAFSPAGYHQAVALDEVTSVEKFGPAATILTGALAAFRGIEVGISEFIRDDLAATGVNINGGPNDKTTVLLYNKKRFYWGRRRPVRVRVQMDLPDQDRWLLASYQRIDFQGHEQGANEVSCVVGVDVTP
jgi:HK97 family phage major capsid protein